jgi:uncharacterized protein with FMN-binding domain
MRRAIVALVVTVVAVVLLAGYDTHPPGSRSLDTPQERRAAVRAMAPPRAVERERGGRRSVSATGPAVTTPFSVIQVRATLTGRRLTGVHTVAMSGDGPHTEALNAKAEPILRREALRAHSARIDTVSGATYSSEAWVESLQAAIDAARARQGVTRPPRRPRPGGA